jgi:Fic family protein
MFVPEYSITSEILKNIAAAEYCRALIENTTILPHWKTQLKKEAETSSLMAMLEQEGYKFEETEVKKELDGYGKRSPQEIKNVVKALSHIYKLSRSDDIDEVEIKELHKTISDKLTSQLNQGRYRSTKIDEGTRPEAILAEVVELFDWLNSLDAKDTHPILVAGIVQAQIEKIKPFDQFNSITAGLFAKLVLKVGGYSLDDYLSFEDFFTKNQRAHEKALDSIEDDDFTKWLEYYTDAVSREVSNLKEKILLLAKDTKVAKASGRVELTDRQEEIVAYMQDYGILRNKDFGKIFTDISEDTVLRDLKVLIDKGIVVKRGKTKSSRYELK